MLPESVRAAIHRTSDAAWTPWTIALLLGSGLLLTVRLRFVQVVRLPEAVRAIVPTPPGAGGVPSPFQAFMAALALRDRAEPAET